MANQPRPKARHSRALGIALTPKCARYLEKRPYPPGQHGRGRKPLSEYGKRLLEKQRLRAQYDVSETALRRAFERARRSRSGKTGEALVVELETRLDAVVLRSGLARTVYQARQFVVHRHIAVNGQRVDRPSYQVRPGDQVAVLARSRDKAPFRLAAAGGNAGEVPPYLDARHSALEVTMLRWPERSEVPVICDEHLVVEFYSR